MINTSLQHCLRLACLLLVICLLTTASTVDGQVSTTKQSDRSALAIGSASDLPPRLYGEVHALCIGIDMYRSQSIPPLHWAEADAEAVAKLFESHYGYTTQRLIGQQATRDKIHQALEKYSKDLKPDDALLVFFAGHGATVELDSYGRTGYLVPFDAPVRLDDTRDPSEWEESALNMQSLGAMIADMKARHVLFLADACYSGFLGKRGMLGGRTDLSALLRRPSRMAMTAGTEGQSAYENASLKHGIFTHYILEQLKNEWPISASELFVSVRESVARESDNTMLPQLREIVVNNGEFVFLPKRVADAEIPGVIADANKRINRRVAKQTTESQVMEAFESFDYRFSADPASGEREWKKRLKRFEDNAALGDELAMAGLHYCYFKGLGTEVDSDKALVWAQRCYDSHHPAGKHVLGHCYLNGIGVDLNPTAGKALLEESARGGFFQSKLELAIMKGLDASEESQTSIKILKKASAAGSKAAMLAAATMQLGIDPKFAELANKESALKLMTSAAEAGSAEAAFNLFKMKSGIYQGFEVDLDSAFSWLEKAATAGLAEAQARMARFIYVANGAESMGLGIRNEAKGDGFALSKDYRILLLVTQVIENSPADKSGKVKGGDLIAAITGSDGVKHTIDSLEHGNNLLRGKRGSSVTLTVERNESKPFEVLLKRDKFIAPRTELWVSRSYLSSSISGSMAEAVRWARMGASQNDPLANYLLAIMYEYGDGVPINYATAKKYCEKSIEANFGPAITRLGVWHLDGVIAPQNAEKSMELFKRSSALHDPEAYYQQAWCFDTVQGVRLGKYSRSEMQGIYQPQALHWYTQAYLADYPMAAGQLAKCNVLWFRLDTPVLSEFKQKFPESYKAFRDFQLERGSDPDKWRVP